VQSLSSWITNLAAELLVPVPRLMVAIASRYGAGAFTQTINGTHIASAHVARAFATWTGQTEIERLSFLRFRSGLHLNKDFRRTRAWCPRCLTCPPREAFDLLAWGLVIARRCPRDGVLLREVCVHCKQTHRVWDLWAHPTRCHHCGMPLGDPHFSAEEVDPETAAAASVVAWTQEDRQIEPRRIAAWVRHYQGHAATNATANHLGLSTWTLANVASGRYRLQMSTLVALLIRAPTDLREMHDWDPVELPESPQPRIRGAYVDVTALEREVEAELGLAPHVRRSIRELAQDLGVNAFTLRRRVSATDRLVDERQGPGAWKRPTSRVVELRH
jgi:hypothetical protein